MRILIVDDNEDSRMILENIFVSMGHSVEAANNGKEALNVLKALRPDMIIADILMPVMDGFQLCRSMKSNEELKHIPFIFYTATYTDEKDEDFALKMGADKFLRKPMEPDEFTRIVQEVIEDIENGKLITKAPDWNREKEVFKLYSERLVKKLEEKMLALEREMNERMQAEEKLRKSREELRNLSAYLQSVREQERTLVAREIHDEMGQALTGLKMDLSWVKKRLPQASKSLFEKTESMLRLIDRTIQFSRKIISELRPGLLDDFGLAAAIEWQADEFQKRTGIQCEVTINPEDIILDKDLATAIFRIFQETLTNVARHANATRVEIGLEEKTDALELTVSDNGKGIKEEEISHPNAFGLIGIRERVYQFGGELNIRGIKAKGTTVTICVPLKKESFSVDIKELNK